MELMDSHMDNRVDNGRDEGVDDMTSAATEVGHPEVNAQVSAATIVDENGCEETGAVQWNGHGPGQQAGRTGKGRTPWRCGRFPTKRCYKTMRSAEWAAQVMRRRDVDGHLVQVFECGTHLHVGHATEPDPDTVVTPRPVPPALTHTLALPAELLARLGLSDG